LVGLLGADKKARRGEARFVMLARVGEVARRGEEWSHHVPLALVEEVLGETAAEA
jgi:3-dehydroquinate synthetase